MSDSCGTLLFIRKLIIVIVLQVRTIVQKSFKTALDQHDILISPAAPSAAYKIGMLLKFCLHLCNIHFFFPPFKSIIHLLVMFTGEKKNDPLAMYAGDIMTVSI